MLVFYSVCHCLVQWLKYECYTDSNRTETPAVEAEQLSFPATGLIYMNAELNYDCVVLTPALFPPVCQCNGMLSPVCLS